MSAKSLIKKIIPESLLSLYHLALSHLACLYYNNPSKKIIVIGVTGTKGKSSVANFIWSCLETAGYKTGIISTAIIRISKEEFPNNYHMTMPGRFSLQKLLYSMYKAGCKFAIVETTSQGIKQYRHIGIKYAYTIFTNLYPEHLDSHNGSMEEYKKTKGKMFESLPKVSIVNNDSPYKDYFLSFKSGKKVTYGLKSGANLQATNIVSRNAGSTFTVDGNEYKVVIPGIFNVENSLPAIALCQILGIKAETIATGLLNLKTIPGRMEPIDLGQPFKVYIDYAHQKESMQALLETAKNLVDVDRKIVVLLGAEGGGRDRAKRPAMGRLAGKLADYVVVSNVDPYDDNPEEIIEDIAKAVEAEGKIRGKNLFTIQDRRLGIRQALTLAKPDDIVFITGKGSEQSMIIAGKKIPWDDRVVVREEIKRLL